MSSGIYKLVFKGIHRVYIGQSIDISRRFREHLCTLKAGKGVSKLQSAYNLYGEPTLVVLEECASSLLNDREVYYIGLYNSFNNGYNSTEGGSDLIGISNPQAKYLKEDYYMVLYYLSLTPTMTFKEIQDILEVDFQVVSSISRGLSHLWLKEEFPDLYSKVMRISEDGRRSIGHTTGTAVLYSPDNVPTSITNINEFTKEYQLGQSHVSQVISGTRLSHKGWTLYPKPILPKVISPSGTIYPVPFRGSKIFAKEHKLEYTSFRDLLNGTLKQHKGWRLLVVEH